MEKSQQLAIDFSLLQKKINKNIIIKIIMKKYNPYLLSTIIKYKNITKFKMSQYPNFYIYFNEIELNNC